MMQFYLKINITFKDKVIIYVFLSAPILDLTGKFYFPLWNDDNRICAHISLILGKVLASLMLVARDKVPIRKQTP